MMDVASEPAPKPPIAINYASMPIPPGTQGFKRLGTNFSFCGVPYCGNAIASENAIYLTLNVLRGQSGIAAGVAGGAIGGLIAGIAAEMAQSKAKQMDRSRIITAAQLPPDVRQHPAWPAKKLKDNVEVVVIPKHEIAAPGVVHPKRCNFVKLQIDGNTALIEYAVFRGAKVKAFLEAAGWPLAWRQNISFHNRDGADPRKTFRKKIFRLVAGFVVVLALAVCAFFYFGLNGPEKPTKSLFEAAQRGDVETIKAHQKFGTNFNGNEAALWAAAHWNRTEAVEAMLEAGANPDIYGPDAHTAAYAAVERGNVAIVKMLIQHRANLDIRDVEGYAPIHIAAREGRTEIVRAILDYGYDVNSRTASTHETPLMLAADLRNPECLETVRLLLSRGADKTLRNNGWGTAFDRHEQRMSSRTKTPEDVELSRLLKP